jgi:hypothetical protein
MNDKKIDFIYLICVNLLIFLIKNKMSSGNTIVNAKKLNDLHQWEGIKLEMSDPTKNIILKIDNESQCCEVWGYNISYSETIFTNLEDFIGAIFISSEIIEYDTFCKDSNKDRVSIGIKIITDRGNITVEFYNDHNGYYPHDVSIQIEDYVKIISL